MIQFRAFILALPVLLVSLAVHADSIVYQVEIDGLACPFCVYGIEKQLSQVEGVSELKTDIKAGIVLVTVAEGATLDEDAVRQAVTHAGFTLRSFSQRDGNPSNE